MRFRMGEGLWRQTVTLKDAFCICTALLTRKCALQHITIWYLVQVMCCTWPLQHRRPCLLQSLPCFRPPWPWRRLRLRIPRVDRGASTSGRWLRSKMLDPSPKSGHQARTGANVGTNPMCHSSVAIHVLVRAAMVHAGLLAIMLRGVATSPSG